MDRTSSLRIFGYSSKDLWGRVAYNVKERGLLRTMQILCFRAPRNYLINYYFDLRYGVKTLGRVELDDLGISSKNKQGTLPYEPSHIRPFNKLMNTLNFPSDSVFVDFGSGKGRVLLIASKYKFKRIVGVEFAHELCEEAKRNVSIYRKKLGIDVDFEIIESDVVDYEFKDDENVFYLFNPFNTVVMNMVLKNIKMSFERNPRKIWLIDSLSFNYDAIGKQGDFTLIGSVTYDHVKFDVYILSP